MHADLMLKMASHFGVNSDSLSIEKSRKPINFH